MTSDIHPLDDTEAVAVAVAIFAAQVLGIDAPPDELRADALRQLDVDIFSTPLTFGDAEVTSLDVFEILDPFADLGFEIDEVGDLFTLRDLTRFALDRATVVEVRELLAARTSRLEQTHG